MAWLMVKGASVLTEIRIRLRLSPAQFAVALGVVVENLPYCRTKPCPRCHWGSGVLHRDEHSLGASTRGRPQRRRAVLRVGVRMGARPVRPDPWRGARWKRPRLGRRRLPAWVARVGSVSRTTVDADATAWASTNPLQIESPWAAGGADVSAQCR